MPSIVIDHGKDLFRASATVDNNAQWYVTTGLKNGGVELSCGWKIPVAVQVVAFLNPCSFAGPTNEGETPQCGCDSEILQNGCHHFGVLSYRGAMPTACFLENTKFLLK